MSVFGKITGGEALQKSLAEFAPAAEKAVMRPALRAGAKVALTRVKELAPIETGELKRSLKVKSIERSRTKIGSRIMTSDGLFRGDTYYGGFQELGTKYMEGKRFIRQGLYESEESVLRVVIETATEKVPVVAEKVRRKNELKAQRGK